MYTLGIETSCDETAASVVCGPQKVLSNVVSSSLSLHAQYGGIIPEIASRAHLEAICSVVDTALKAAKISHKKLGLIAVTQGPGLVGSLLVGISFARSLALAWKLPLVGVNHVRAHMYASFIENKITFPFVGLVVSGGHTSLYRVSSLDREEVICSTRDDAAGEAFDKTAKILGLGYPGGPVIERLAKSGNPAAYPFRCSCGLGLDFSFSGIKTAVLYKAGGLKKIYGRLSKQVIADMCASFQDTVVRDLVVKSMRAVKKSRAMTLVVGGGVAFNGYLRDRLAQAGAENGIRILIAPKSYCLDNAAMVASLGTRLFSADKRKKYLRLDPLGG
ncbi:MAG TPA: tRNA (adenosine(37)-N6)-threonylcarbamoyltransferase complex transferase subunit TsaD [Candidatus Omnitrophica bacterium]|nr:tRNA (adenosine(37)-N6)-threonylcarbamoyltransferase complex transferase subunit TsaD [Candidatus Omnitrophota bacterium]